MPVGVDANGLWHVIKTAKIVAGGTSAAPRLAKNHLFKVGEFISDGKVALEIATVTKGDTYDTLTFAAGVLLTFAANTVLYQAAAANTTGGTAAAATVTGDVDDTLTVLIPAGSSPANFNGLRLKIAQAADDVLAVAYEDGVLTISLAKTTATKNNVALIQAAIRALGLVAPGLDFSAATVTGAAGWDGAQTGAVLTTATDAFEGGVNIGTIAYIYTPAAITMNKVDLTVANQTSGLLEAGKVTKAVMPFPIDAALEAALKDIRFV
ncbi:MAG: hypothetical protein AB2L20_14840 [Mangrovibacterium sp.]